MNRLVILSVAAILAGGCTSWRAMPPSPEALKDGPPRIAVILPSNDTLPMRDPAIERDSLIGWVDVDGGVQRRAFAMTDLKAVVVLKANYGPAILGGLPLGVVSFWVLIGSLYAAST